jgi:23S rRNA G2445 N2-methylase RlmL
VELVPRLSDPRFAYRKGDVPAASHPTIAAALIRAATTRKADVVWDPFVGSGTELCERAIAGSYATLTGSDVDPAALEVARANLEACGAHDVTLLAGDATSLRPPGPRPTLIVTNPPLGRRVQRSAALAPLLDRFVTHAAELLAPGGILSWISPFPERTRDVAERCRLLMMRALEVDLGGFDAELQVWRKAGRGTADR